MPDLDDQDAARRHGPADGSAPSRRSVLRVAAGAGAAAGLAATALGSMVTPALASTRAAAARTPPDEVTTTDPLVLHVRDAATGEIDVFRGATQTRLHDRDLAARIIRASQ